MQLSGEEFLRVSRSAKRQDGSPDSPALGRITTAPARVSASSWEAEGMSSPSLREDVSSVVNAVSRTADVREHVIASLRERIQSGAYQVSGEQVAEMMVRRLLADRIR